MYFVGFLTSINSTYFTCSDSNIHIDVPVGEGYKFIIDYIDYYVLKPLVSQPTHLHGQILDLILFPSDQDTFVYVKICHFYLIMQ